MTGTDTSSPAPSPSNRPTPGAHHLAAAAEGAGQDGSLALLSARLAEQLPELELGACIGRGGMGAVFRARQRALDRDVAVKLLVAPPGDQEAWFQRFRREAQTLARLQHPGIVTIHDHGQSGDLAWLVMEFVDGTNLRALLEDGRLTPREALAIVPPLCEALQYAHERGVVHRDIKPENVLLDTEGRVKLVDFGLAKLSDSGEGPQLTRSDQAMGTPRYMAPEQLERPREVDHRADIFSLGVVLYEMLTGHVPAGVVEPPSRKVAVDVRLDEVVLRALQREPERRYQSASDLEAGVKHASEVPSGRVVPAPAARPIRAGLAWADAIAIATPFLAVAVLAVWHPKVFAAVPSPIWEFLLPWFLIGLAWCGMSVVGSFQAARWRRRGSAVSPAMPMVRAVWSLAWTLVALVVVESFRDHPAFNAPEQDALVAVRGLVLVAGLSAAALGAYSERGAHRPLLGRTSEHVLLALAGSCVGVAAVLGTMASLSDRASLSAPGYLHDASLPFVLQIPPVAAGAIALTLGRHGNLRAAAFALAIGTAFGLAAHLLGRIHYAGAGAVLGCLAIAVLCSLVSVAGTAGRSQPAQTPRRP